MTKEKTMQA
jgi:hypothetical protein